MSAMKDLYLKVAADAVLQEKVSKIFEVAGEDSNVAGAKLVEFAKEEGYDVTIEEITEFFTSLSEISDKPLNDEDLEAVAGGKAPGGGGGPMVTVWSILGPCIGQQPFTSGVACVIRAGL